MAAPQTENKIFTAICMDFETGGLECISSACTQIAMQAVRLDTWETIDRYVRYIQPYEKQDIGGQAKRKVLKSKHEMERGGELMDYQPVALTYSGITMDTLYKTGTDMKEVAQDVLRFIGKNTLTKGAQFKPVLIGQNIQFDIGFLQQLMNYAGLAKDYEKIVAGKYDFYGNFQPHYIDTIDLGHLAFAHDCLMPSYKLEMIAEKLGIDLDDAHDADADVTATLNIVRVCASRIRSREGNSDEVVQKQEKTRNHFKI